MSQFEAIHSGFHVALLKSYHKCKKKSNSENSILMNDYLKWNVEKNSHLLQILSQNSVFDVMRELYICKWFLKVRNQFHELSRNFTNV